MLRRVSDKVLTTSGLGLWLVTEQDSSVEKQFADTQRQISVQALREALENLYANVELATSDLAKHIFLEAQDVTVTQRAQTLRNLLLDAIESLRPLRPTPPHVFGAERSYEVLSLRYVSGYSVDKIADYLSLSERQIYRDLRRGEESLVEILEAEFRFNKSAVRPDAVVALREEISVLAEQPQPVDLNDNLRKALSIIQPILQQQAVYLEPDAPDTPVWVLASPGILTEVLIQMLSAIVQQCNRGQRLNIEQNTDGRQVEFCVIIHAPHFSPRNPLLRRALQTARSLGFDGRVESGDIPDAHKVVLSVNAVQPRPVLVIEDNVGACELYQRYLQGSEWSIVFAGELGQAIALVESVRPVAIILDILMSDMDGWSVLQALRLRADIADIPIIVCSAISDPQLATALGASASLSKPLSRQDLLGILKRFAGSHTDSHPDFHTGSDTGA